jgi:hypothetical protein
VQRFDRRDDVKVECALPHGKPGTVSITAEVRAMDIRIVYCNA